jgi:hypothetical protein
MGNTHFRSNIKGHDGTEKLIDLAASLSGGTFSGSPTITTPDFSGGASFKLGANLYVMWGTATLPSAIEALATALCTSTPEPGCVYISSGQLAGHGFRVRGHNAASWGVVGWIT